MVFGLFTRKYTLDDTAGSQDQNDINRLPTPTPSIASASHHFPSAIRAVLAGTGLKDASLATDGGHHAPPPPDTPTPPPAGAVDTKPLYDLLLTIPPKTLHAYTLAHLRPAVPPPSASPSHASHPDNDTAPRPPSPHTLTKLASFFSTLAPPPLRHCVRCHNDFYDVENEDKDKACRVAHDDDSALVSRVSSGGYETLWGCCGQTAPGDGSEGPPDGWCYEGRHTIDIRRARFRADSTMHDDKLTSCLKVNCHGIRDRLPRGDVAASPSRGSVARRSNPSPVRSQASRSTLKRPRKSLKGPSGSEDEHSSIGRAPAPKGNLNVHFHRKDKDKDKDKDKARRGADERDADARMAVDEPDPPSSKPKTKTKSRPIVVALSHSRPPPSASTSTIASVPSASKAKTTPAKPKSTSHTLLSQSHTHLGSDSEESTRARPRTRSHVREESRVRDASRSRTNSKLTKATLSERVKRGRKAARPRTESPTSEEEQEAETTDEDQEGDQEERGRDRKKRRVRRD